MSRRTREIPVQVPLQLKHHKKMRQWCAAVERYRKRGYNWSQATAIADYVIGHIEVRR